MIKLTQQEVWAMWRAGEVHELANVLNDMKEGENTFFKYIDAEVGYPYPVFVYGDESVFDRYQRVLIELSQASVN
jgi:hypothetical protein